MWLKARCRGNLSIQGMFMGCLALAIIGWPGLGLGQEASDDQVQAFAKAHVEVTRIHSTAQVDKELPKTIAQINAESVPHKETRERIIQAIEAEGLTVDDYNALMETYQTSENFRSEVTMTILDLN